MGCTFMKISKKLTKSEALALRLDPKIKYGLELLARKQKRSLTSVVEWIVHEALRTELVVEVRRPATLFSGNVSYEEYFLDDIWDEDPLARLIKLVDFDKSLMTFDEERCWDLILKNGYYWKGKLSASAYTWDTGKIDHLRLDRVRSDFETLQNIAQGKAGEEALNQYWEAKSFSDASTNKFSYEIDTKADYEVIASLTSKR